MTPNSKVPPNQTACVGIDTRGYFVKLTNSEACNNACEAYHHKSARDTGISRSGRRRLDDGQSSTHKVFVETAALKRLDFNPKIAHPPVLRMMNSVHPTILGRRVRNNKELAAEHTENAYVRHRKRNLPQKIFARRESFSVFSRMLGEIQFRCTS